MSHDVKCPYCKAGQDICHDDGFGYSEGEDHEMQCGECDKMFLFQTSIMMHYDVYCQEKDHVMSAHTVDFYTCDNCEYSELREAFL